MSEHQSIALADQLLLVFQRAGFGRDTVCEVDLSPAWGCFNGVERGHGSAFGNVLALLALEDLHLSESEDVVILARRELHGGDTDITALDAIVPSGVRLEGREAGVPEVVHERRVMLAPEVRVIAAHGGRACVAQTAVPRATPIRTGRSAIATDGVVDFIEEERVRVEERGSRTAGH